MCIRDSGVKEYYEWRIDRIPLPDGRHGVVCYFRDISSQVLARQQIADSEERYRGHAKLPNQQLERRTIFWLLFRMNCGRRSMPFSATLTCCARRAARMRKSGEQQTSSIATDALRFSSLKT